MRQMQHSHHLQKSYKRSEYLQQQACLEGHNRRTMDQSLKYVQWIELLWRWTLTSLPAWVKTSSSCGGNRASHDKDSVRTALLVVQHILGLKSADIPGLLPGCR